MEKKTDYKCICLGDIVEDSHIPMMGNPDVYGPGGMLRKGPESSRQITGYHCSHCGIEYNKGVIQKFIELNKKGSL